MPDEVISNTTPIQYLHQAGLLDLLPTFYESVTIPEGVAVELIVGHSKGVSLPDLNSLSWLKIRPAPHLPILPLATDLGQGEREVLALATGRSGVLALLDDALARHFAKHLKILFTGTLGVLLKAKAEKYVKRVAPILDHLQALGFWLDPKTRSAVLKIADES